MIKTPFPSQATRISVDMEVKAKGDRKHIPKDTKAKPEKHPSDEEDDEGEDEEENDESEEFKSLELDSEDISSDKLPLPAPIKDLEAQKKTFGPTINKSTGLPFGWKREVRWYGTGAQKFSDIRVTTSDGRFLFDRKSQLMKYC